MRILFVCVGNAGRSQMAEAFCRELDPAVECASAGTNPAGAVMPETVKVMAEVGIDVSGAHPKGFSDLPYPRFDCLVTMGREVVCPFLPSARLVKWNLPDPCGRSIDDYRRVRDRIRKQVQGLLGRLPADSR